MASAPVPPGRVMSVTPVCAGDNDVPARRNAPGWDQAGQQQLQALEGCAAILTDRSHAVDALGEQIGQRRQVALDGPALLAVLVDHLHECAEAYGYQEGNDEYRSCAPKR